MAETVVLPVEGMTCGACSARVGRGLSDLPGVDLATVNLATERATVVYDPTEVDLEAFQRAVAALGYRIPEEPPGDAVADPAEGFGSTASTDRNVSTRT